VRNKTKKIGRIGIIPVETAGYVAGLESGLTSLGYSVRAVTIDTHPAKYGQLITNPLWARLECKVSDLRSLSHPFLHPVLFILSLALRTWGTLWVLQKFDHLILNNGRSLLPLHVDLLLYKARGISLIAMMGHGSEIRPACIDSLGDKRAFTTRQRRNIYKACFSRRRFVRRVESLAGIVISTPTLSHYLRRSYVNGHSLGIPVLFNFGLSSSEKTESQSGDSVRVPKVVHIPSQPNLKGTALIMELCQQLEKEGLMTFEMKSKVTHRETVELLAGADLLVDQLYSDIYMPVLATEAAFLSKPAVVAGYAWGYLEETSSRSYKPPVINVEPEELERTLRGLIRDSSKLVQIGKEAEEYVKNRRDSVSVAKRYVGLLEDRREYIIGISEDPTKPKYLFGCGSSREAISALSGKLDVRHRCFPMDS